ncbi:unnamed protein product [Chondrus crispus]|uniref:Uncharacterized protein n=1 Tax=Chondrus crispus TaxID=2769 RepID=R7Q7L1_CHOCR|nr:unnamed protein product [Chondrus crispus]CDF33828.1 unnamed protein product [Chondrus crispus]|eukprot:XP_005713647.1 unnamed protein product [Chondrus crispus]
MLLEDEKREYSKARKLRESERWQKAHQKNLRLLAVKEKRVELRERPFDLEKEEKKGGDLKRTHNLSMPSALVKKLECG